MKKNVVEFSTLPLTVVFLVAVSVVFFLLGIIYKQVNNQIDYSDRLENAYESSHKLESVYTKLKEIENERRNYIITQNEDSHKIIDRKFAQIYETLENLESNYLKEGPVNKELVLLKQGFVDEITKVNKSYKRHVTTRDPILLEKEFKRNELDINNLRRRINTMISLEDQIVKDTQGEFVFNQKSSTIYILLIAIISLSVLSFAFFKILKEVKEKSNANKNFVLSLEISQLAETIGDFGLWIYYIDRDEFFITDHLYHLLGYPPSGFKPSFKRLLQFVHRDDKKLFFYIISRITSGESVDGINYRLVRPDGEIIYVSTTGNIAQTGNNEQIILGITNNVTEDVKRDNELKSFNERIVDKNKTLRIANKTYKSVEELGDYGSWQYIYKTEEFRFSNNIFKIFGFTENTDNLGYDDLHSRVHEDDLERVKEKEKGLAEQKKIDPFVFRIRRKDNNEIRYISLNGSPIEDALVGEYFLVIAQDITARYLERQSIKEQNKILEANNKELKAFNYVASHDLQEPLRKIETFISRLVDKEYENLSDTGKTYLERISFSAGKMRTLISDLLQFSRATKSKENMKETDLNELIENSLDLLNESINEKEAKINYETLPTLKVVPFQIQQVFTNLIGNAIKYSKDSVAPNVEIDYQKVDAQNDTYLFDRNVDGIYHRFEVKDNGIGFEQDYEHKVFELFNRLHSSSKYQGSGIGLAICKKIVDNHDGFIYAKSALGEGSTFVFYLPEEAQDIV